MSVEAQLRLIGNKIDDTIYVPLKGRNDFIGYTNYTQVTETISEDSSVFQWQAVGGNSTAYVKCDNNSDTGKQLIVEYIDDDFVAHTATLPLPTHGSTNGVQIASNVFRINKATVSSPLTGNVQIYVPYMYGSQQDIYNITQGNTEGRQAVFTVPKGETYAIIGIDVLGKTEDNALVTTRVRHHTVGEQPISASLGFNDLLSVNMPVGTVSNSSSLVVPYLMPEGSELEVQGTKLGTGSSTVTEIQVTLHMAKFINGETND